MTAQPVIGIAGASYDASKQWGALAVSGAATAVVDAIAAAGGVPLILPVVVGAETAVLDRLDGLVLAGGGDLDPLLYGSVSRGALDVDRARDARELALLRAAHESRLPLLGLCRGLQVMAVGFQGSLHTHLGDHRPHVILDGGHPVTTSAGSLCRLLFGERAVVNSLHHQAVRDPGNRWKVTTIADDGIIEALEWADRAWPALGVQWHPELAPHDLTSTAVFGWLVETASRRTMVRV